MSNIKITGGKRLEGTISVQGAKNSVLPILAAAILVNGESRLQNCPNLKDVDAAIMILEHLGCKITRNEQEIVIDSSSLDKSEIPDHLMREMRSSVIFLGAILGRTGRATLSTPGGCELGKRPINLHIDALRQLGAEIDVKGPSIDARADRLVGCTVNFETPSVGATENAMLAALCAEGETIITNAAREPEIVDLQNFLVAAGAKIRGAGQSTIVVSGGAKLRPVTYSIMPDRIVACTYLCAVASTGGHLEMTNIIPEHIEAVTNCLETAGCKIEISGSNLVMVVKKRINALRPIITRPYPGFPTDAQPCLVASCATAKGTTVVIENIFDNRYGYVDELRRMGADIKLEGRVAIVTGVKRLTGATVKATDLRGGAALVVAALAAAGETEITEIAHIDRGYDRLEETLSALGADITRT